MIQAGYSVICIVVNGDNMNCGQMIEELKKFPKNKPVMIMGWYSIAETDEPEDIKRKINILSEYYLHLIYRIN